jgi:hypothetical protein
MKEAFFLFLTPSGGDSVFSSFFFLSGGLSRGFVGFYDAFVSIQSFFLNDRSSSSSSPSRIVLRCLEKASSPTMKTTPPPSIFAAAHYLDDEQKVVRLCRRQHFAMRHR